ncbi:hypothetical protein L1987_02986 [Smallanthus sonchifolius]|uniref:Uncharacterized protein n=1 Tax=Smallanthus sonchifolius TaxID=185202 RepID=A0ACB9K9B9_9ASTR|nr:hypothetical protein L1987_02986 [Smallanthus sonchifolius]
MLAMFCTLNHDLAPTLDYGPGKGCMMKFHLAQIKNKDIVPCTEVPDDVRDHIRVILSLPKKQKPPKKQNPDHIDAGTGQQNSSSASGGLHLNNHESNGHYICGNYPPLMSPRPSLSPLPVVDDIGRKKQDDADKKVALFFYHNAIPFSAAKFVYYQEMVDAIAECGGGYEAPSYEKMRSSLLERVKGDFGDEYKRLRVEWKETGCTIFKKEWVNIVLEEANAITTYLYSHEWTLNRMGKCTSRMELIRAKLPKHISIFLSLRSLVIQEDNLKHMFSGVEWSSSTNFREPDSQATKSLLYSGNFWKSANEVIDLRIRNGFQEAMLKIANEDRIKSRITKEHPVYLNAQGALGTDFAIMGRTLNAPGDWWSRFGTCKPIIFDEIDVDSEWPTELHSSPPLLDDSWLDTLPIDCTGSIITRSISFRPKMKSDLKDKIFLTMINYWSWWWEVDNERDELSRTILTILVPILVLLWYKWTISFTHNGRSRFPPGPYGLPVFGYLPFLSHNLHERFTEMAYRYGPIFSLRLGSKFHVVVNSMDLAKVVARDLDQTFANRSPSVTALTISYNALDITFSNNNAHWRNMRKLLVSQVMSNANLDACQDFRTREVRKTVSNVYARMGTAVDVNEIAFDTELNVATNMLWGCSSDSGDLFHGFREVGSKITELLAAPNISDFIPMLSWFDLQGRKREMKKQQEHLDWIFESIIQERIKTNSKKMEGEVEEDGRKDFLQIMLELKDQKDASTSFDMVHIKALLFDILTAATDTTSTMVEWVMAEILRNPGVKTKIQEELTDVVGINIVEESHMPRLKYLDAVVKETFRVHPPLPLLIQRSPDESCTVGGYLVPKGSIVYINVCAIQRDPKNWTDPLEFKPERFLYGKWDYTGNNLKYLPFGSGRRTCPGVPLGEKMLMYILASLLHSFDWILPKDEEFELSDEFGFVTKKRKPLVAIPSQRLSDATLCK